MGQTHPRIEDEGGSLAMNVHRRTALKGMLGTSAVVKTYPDASQFWTYDPDEFLKHPVYNRERWPGSKNIEP
jgi:branched-chain amino acid transport system substrate-binding protein